MTYNGEEHLSFLRDDWLILIIGFVAGVSGAAVRSGHDSEIRKWIPVRPTDSATYHRWVIVNELPINLYTKD